MIDKPLVVRTSLLAGVILLVAVTFASIFLSPAFGGGVFLGGLVGAITPLSWIWFTITKRNKTLATMLLLTKLGLYGGLFYIFVGSSLVDPIAVFLGITATTTLYAMALYSRVSAPTEEAR
jgi:hypothetical protein|tara:strand:- start:9 stop:371 length:363 start_codon:yes stop_codon:yes gene_type:complete